MTQIFRQRPVSCEPMLCGYRRVSVKLLATLDEISDEYVAELRVACSATGSQLSHAKRRGEDRWYTTLVLIVRASDSEEAVAYLTQHFPLSEEEQVSA